MWRIMYMMIFAGIVLEASSCWKIRNMDTRALCEAKYEHKKSCWKIKNDDLRAYCEATAEKQRNCWKIKENDLKAMCESEAAFQQKKNADRKA